MGGLPSKKDGCTTGANNERYADIRQVKELSIDYTKCLAEAPQVDANYDSSKPDPTSEMDGKLYSASFGKAMTSKPRWGQFEEEFTWPSGHKNMTKFCVLVFQIPENIKPPVLFYYRLTNFYQNHRRYVKSLDVNQLKGDAVSAADIASGECDPLGTKYHADDNDTRAIYPCGLIANSMFNDTFSNLNSSNAPTDSSGNQNQTYNFSKKGIMWDTEGDLYGETKYDPKDIRPPPNWVDQYPSDGYASLKKEQLPNLHTDEAFQVWMRTAGLPYFSKLAQRNDNDELEAATYRLKIRDRKTRLFRCPV